MNLESSVYHHGVDSVNAFVLAGGKSSRMGRDKAFLQLGGRTLLARALELAGAVADNTWIVGSPEKFAEIGPVVQGLADRLAEGARQKGYQVLGDRTPENGSGIVALHKPNLDSRNLVRDLKERGIIAAPRQGWVRFSPHFYISPEEIDRVVEALP